MNKVVAMGVERDITQRERVTVHSCRLGGRIEGRVFDRGDTRMVKGQGKPHKT